MSDRLMFKVRKIAERSTQITSCPGYSICGIFRCPICSYKDDVLSYEGAVEYGMEHLLDNHILKERRLG